MIPGSANPLLLASAAAPTGYNIERSLRFNSADSAYLSRTPASAGNRKTWTWAGWVKRSTQNTANNEFLFESRFGSSDSTIFSLGFANGGFGTTKDALVIFRYSFYSLITTQLFRDTSAWYHIVLNVDTTQATASDRIRLYVNGVRITAFSSATYPALNEDLPINTTNAHIVGGQSYFNGYLADIHFIDGQALDPTSFTEVDATTGQLIPKAYTGSYGTNGFHLPFSDNSTAAALGTDTSGAGNNWTVNNISVAAGAGNDSLVDTPTSSGTDTGAGGEVRGNYATLNPLSLRPNITLANGNLDYTLTSTASPPYAALSTIAPSSGKWYTEITLTSSASAGGYTYWAGGGLYSSSYSNFTGASANTSPGYGGFWSAGVRVTSYFTWATNDIIGFAWDLNAATLSVYKNGALVASGLSIPAGTNFFGVEGGYSPTSSSVNFGQRPFAYTAPSGFKALCDSNIAEGSITTSGSFTGNASADGPFIWLNGVPTAMTINSNAVTFGTHADKLANGFKLRTSSTSYNTAGSNTYSITTTGAKFKYARAQSNP